VVRDVAAVCGLGLLTLGAGMVYLPAAPLTAGCALLAFALLGWYFDRGGRP
jgi:hypothetical protein